MTPLQYALVLAAGLLAGFFNVVAAGGSLVALPALIFAGLPATVANGTNRVAILAQNLVAVRAYHTRGVGDLRRALLLAVPAMAGSVLGAYLATQLDARLFRRLIGAILLAMIVVLLLRPARWLEGAAGRQPRAWLSVLVFFGLGVYGGFIQAGIGVLLLAALVLVEGQDLLTANAAKVAIVLAYTVVALAIFARATQVDWRAGLVLACGNMAGAQLGATLAIEKGAPWIMRVLVVVLLVCGTLLLLGR